MGSLVPLLPVAPTEVLAVALALAPTALVVGATVSQVQIQHCCVIAMLQIDVAPVGPALEGVAHLGHACIVHPEAVHILIPDKVALLVLLGDGVEVVVASLQCCLAIPLLL